MSYKIYNYRTYDLSEITYQKPVKSSRGNVYTCNVDKPYDVLFQTREIVLPRAIEVGDREASVYVDVANDDHGFGDFIRRLDEHNIEYIYKNCVEWFDRELPYDAIKDFYITNTREDGLVRIPIPVVRKKIDIKIFDSSKNILGESVLVEGARIVLVFRVNGLKFYKKECVLDMDVVQILVVRLAESESASSASSASSKAVSRESQNRREELEVFNRIRFREELKNKKEVARIAFEEAERAQREADVLKTKAMDLAKELKKMEEEYYREDDSMEEEVDEDI